MSGNDQEDFASELYWRHVNPRSSDVDHLMPCPTCGSKDVDHSRGYRGEYSCKKCGRVWRR